MTEFLTHIIQGVPIGCVYARGAPPEPSEVPPEVGARIPKVSSQVPGSVAL